MHDADERHSTYKRSVIRQAAVSSKVANDLLGPYSLPVLQYIRGPCSRTLVGSLVFLGLLLHSLAPLLP